MRRFTPMAAILGVFLLAGCTEQEPAEDMESTEMPAAETEAPAMVSLADFAGDWEGTSIMESGDTVTYTMTATADPDGWIVNLPDRDPMPMRIIAVEGDSVVTEIGPYESLFRDGVMVTVRSVTRLQDGDMVGTMDAHYATDDGDVVVGGTMEATRTM